MSEDTTTNQGAMPSFPVLVDVAYSHADNYTESQAQHHQLDGENEMEESTFDAAIELTMQMKRDEMNESMKKLLDSMSEEQLRRYETYRGAAFGKGPMKKVHLN